MNIGIVDSDLLDNGTRHPNLALMKISAYNKDRGNNVELLNDYKNINDYDEVYLSKVFDFTKIPIDINKYRNIKIGGTGFFWTEAPDLPYEIEHHMPDYHLYDNYIKNKIDNGTKSLTFKDYKDYSIGFTSRGCFRKCPFCVNQKYEKAFIHSPIKEFVDTSRKYIYLWDDNVFACSNWKEIFKDIEDTNKPFQFRQGLDIRLLSKDKCEILARMKYHGDYIFAFDNLDDKNLIIEKLKLWKSYINKTTKLYVFCGFDRNNHYDLNFWKQDIIDTFERIRILMQYQCLPYIMRHENYKNSPFRGMYINLARWCNQPSFFKKKSFQEYCEVNGEDSSTMRYLYEFKKQCPEIAQQYFEIRYDYFGKKTL